MTLSDITGETRAIFKWGAIFLAALIVIFLLMKIKDTIFPAPPPPPTVGFGKLPSIEFPSSTNKNLTYSTNTVTGTLPTFTLSEKVFKMQDVQPDLLSLQRAKEKAKSIDFEGNPAQVSENVYQWKDSKGQILTMNILDFDFNLSSNFLSKEIPSLRFGTDTAVKTAKEFLQRMELFYKDIDEAKTTTELFSIKNFRLIPASSLSSTQVVRVNFFQKDINGLSTYYPSATTPLNLTVADLEDPKVIEGNFFYQNPSEVFSTYPLKTAEQAFDDLKKGNGYISVLPQTANVYIKKVKLGYYVAEKKQKFLLPIIVFEGDNFQAYVSAVTDEWVNK